MFFCVCVCGKNRFVSLKTSVAQFATFAFFVFERSHFDAVIISPNAKRRLMRERKTENNLQTAVHFGILAQKLTLRCLVL